MSKVKSVLGKDLMLFVGGKALALATSVNCQFRQRQSTHKARIPVFGPKRTLSNCHGTVQVKTCSVRMIR